MAEINDPEVNVDVLASDCRAETHLITLKKHFGNMFLLMYHDGNAI